MKDKKYITVLDFSNGRIYQYKLPKRRPFEDIGYERFLINQGHNLNNIEWMAHDIGELVDTKTSYGKLE